MPYLLLLHYIKLAFFSVAKLYRGFLALMGGSEDPMDKNIKYSHSGSTETFDFTLGLGRPI